MKCTTCKGQTIKDGKTSKGVQRYKNPYSDGGALDSFVYDPLGFNEDIFEWTRGKEFTAQIKTKVTLGLQAKIGGNLGSSKFAKLETGINALTADLIVFDTDICKWGTDHERAFNFDYIGENGRVNWTQGATAELSFLDKYGLGGDIECKFHTQGSDMEGTYGDEYSLYAQWKISGKKFGNEENPVIPTVCSNTKVKLSNKFVGIDLGGLLASGIGVKFNIKIRFYE